MDMNERWMRFAALTAGADPDLLLQSNAIDRRAMCSTAISLLQAGVLAVVAWICFAHTFLPWWAASPLGALLGTMVFMLDRSMATSDWRPTGVLSPGRPNAGWWLKQLVRLALAVVLAFATATGVVMVMSNDAIDHLLQTERMQHNEPVLAEYALRAKQARDQLLGGAQAELDLLKAERDRILGALTRRDQMTGELRQRAAAARVEQGRQLEGHLKGYVAGDGPLHRDAKRIETEALRAAEWTAGEALALQHRFDELGPAMAAKSEALRAGSAAARAAEDRIDEQMHADPRWFNEQPGTLSRWVAMEKLRRDPTYGPAVQHHETLLRWTLLAFELTFLAIKVFFTPAMVYYVKLIAKTRLEAAQAVRDHEDALREIRTGRRSGSDRPGVTLVQPPPTPADPPARSAGQGDRL